MPADLPQSDHDLLIRVHERVMSLQQMLQVKTNEDAGREKRIEDLEKWRANMAGRLSVIASFSGALSGVVTALIVKYIN